MLRYCLPLLFCFLPRVGSPCCITVEAHDSSRKSWSLPKNGMCYAQLLLKGRFQSCGLQKLMTTAVILVCLFHLSWIILMPNPALWWVEENIGYATCSSKPFFCLRIEVDTLRVSGWTMNVSTLPIETTLEGIWYKQGIFRRGAPSGVEQGLCSKHIIYFSSVFCIYWITSIVATNQLAWEGVYVWESRYVGSSSFMDELHTAVQDT